MSMKEVQAIHARIVAKLDGQAELDLDGFAKLMRGLLFDISDSSIRQFFDQIDMDSLGTIDTKLLTQDIEFARRVLTVLNESTNQANGDTVIESTEYKQQISHIDMSADLLDSTALTSAASAASVGSVGSDVQTPNDPFGFSTHATIGGSGQQPSLRSMLSSDGGGGGVTPSEVLEKDAIIGKLESEIERLKGWKLEFGDPAVLEVSELQEQIKVYRSEESDLLSKLNEMKDNLEDSRNKEQSTKNDLNLIVNERNELSEELSELNSKYDSKCSELKKLQEQFESTKLELIGLKESNLELNRINEEFESQNEQYKIEINKYKEENSKIMNEETVIIEEFTNEKELEDAKIDELEQQIKELKEQLQSKSIELTNNSRPSGTTSPNAALTSNQTLRYDMNLMLKSGANTRQSSTNKLFANNAMAGMSNASNNGNLAGLFGLTLQDMDSNASYGGGGGGITGGDPFEDVLRKEIEAELTEKLENEMEGKIKIRIEEEKNKMDKKMRREYKEIINNVINKEIEGFENKYKQILKKMESVVIGSNGRLEGLDKSVVSLKEELRLQEANRQAAASAVTENTVHSDSEEDETDGDPNDPINSNSRRKAPNLDNVPVHSTCVLFGWRLG